MATLPVLSRSPVGDTKIPLPIMVPTMREMPETSCHDDKFLDDS